MAEIQQNQYTTRSHKDYDNYELENTFKQTDICSYNNRNLFKDYQVYYRYFRKMFSDFLRYKMQKKFIDILYVTLDCPFYTSNSSRNDNPLEYITELQKQYPNYDVRMIIPVINMEQNVNSSKRPSLKLGDKVIDLEKTGISFNFFLQNKMQNAIVYKFPTNQYNVKIYGIYSSAFSNVTSISELAKLQYSAPFIKSVRIAVKSLAKVHFIPDIIHAENIPYYLGAEFESKKNSRMKVVQVIKDFTQIDMAKTEAFWTILNLANKEAMAKLCRDNIIKKNIANLFNLHNTKTFYKMKECLFFIYKNYYKFRKYIAKGQDIEENIIFNSLNARTVQLFPNLFLKNALYYNSMVYTLKRADFWVVNSFTYYKDIFDNPKLSGDMFSTIEKTKYKSGYISFGCNIEFPNNNALKVYQNFTSENFRDLRDENKKILLKEFSEDRIKTNFIDSTLFKNENVQIIGKLDSFYEAPLLFANLDTDIFACGADIVFNTVLKLFDLHKNIQIIICMKNGTKINFVKSWINFLISNKHLDGRWVFIDGAINLPKFLAASDMILIPRRINMTSIEHFLAIHYGCVPVVSRNGILHDTVADIFDDISGGIGFKTKKSLLSEEDNNELFFAPVSKALNLYQNNPASWNLLVKNCLNYNSSWSFEILEKYNEIYQNLYRN